MAELKVEVHLCPECRDQPLEFSEAAGAYVCPKHGYLGSAYRRFEAEKVEALVLHEHQFSAGPNCSVCGLHAAVVEGGSLSPEVITKVLAEGGSIATSS